MGDMFISSVGNIWYVFYSIDEKICVYPIYPISDICDICAYSKYLKLLKWQKNCKNKIDVNQHGIWIVSLYVNACCLAPICFI